MAFMTEPQRILARALGTLTRANPFLPEWIEAERRILGPGFIADDPVWHARPVVAPNWNPNVEALVATIGALAEALRARLAAGIDPGEDRALYEDVALYLLYHRIEPALYALVTGAGAPRARRLLVRLRARRAPLPRATGPGPGPAQPRPPLRLLLPGPPRLPLHRRAHPRRLAPRRPPACQRVAVHLYPRHPPLPPHPVPAHARRHDAHRRPSGTGKELVARAIGLSRYIPFDPKTHAFAEDFRGASYALNLATLAPTLIESELFGHKKGAFTGAGADRPGWLETCPPLGTVFLDEITEIDTAIQVKLLRVIQSRTFPAGRRHPGAVLLGQDRRREQPRPRRRDRRRPLPRRPLLPPVLGPHRDARARRAAPRRPKGARASAALHRQPRGR